MFAIISYLGGIIYLIKVSSINICIQQDRFSKCLRVYITTRSSASLCLTQGGQQQAYNPNTTRHCLAPVTEGTKHRSWFVAPVSMLFQKTIFECLSFFAWTARLLDIILPNATYLSLPASVTLFPYHTFWLFIGELSSGFSRRIAYISSAAGKNMYSHK